MMPTHAAWCDVTHVPQQAVTLHTSLHAANQLPVLLLLLLMLLLQAA
jgi:hypothetical protein